MMTPDTETLVFIGVTTAVIIALHLLIVLEMIANNKLGTIINTIASITIGNNNIANCESDTAYMDIIDDYSAIIHTINTRFVIFRYLRLRSSLSEIEDRIISARITSSGFKNELQLVSARCKVNK